MDHQDFDQLFAREIIGPLAAIGAFQEEKSLFWQSSNLLVALLRTETESAPPKLTFFVRHQAMRDLDEKVPTRATRRPNDYPFKLRPSDAASLLADDFTYTPHNLGEFPAEEFSCPPESPEAIRERLAAIAAVLLETLPRLDDHLTAERIVAHLVDQGENATNEQMWVQDLT